MKNRNGLNVVGIASEIAKQSDVYFNACLEGNFEKAEKTAKKLQSLSYSALNLARNEKAKSELIAAS